MKILAIDGNSIMNRAYYGIRLPTNSKGFYTNALVGFMNIYLKAVNSVKPNGVVAAFDVHAPTFRHKADADYKATRKGMPPELCDQMPVIKEILRALGTKVIEIEGFEADDILGSVAKLSSESKNECVILTGDRDALQLVSDSVTVHIAKTRETIVYTPDKLFADYGVSPRQMIDIKALQGDASDNIKGVAGIGEKTALSLVKRFHSLDELYDRFEESDLSDAVKRKLRDGKESAYHSRWLGTIVCDAPIDGDINNYYQAAPDEPRLYALLSKYELYRTIERLNLSGPQNAESFLEETAGASLSDIKITSDFDALIASLGDSSTAYFLFSGEVLDICVENTVCRIENTADQLRFFTGDFKKYAFEGKEAHKACMKNGAELKGLVFAADLAGYLLNSHSRGYTVTNLCIAHNVPYRKDVEGYEDIASLPALCQKLSGEIEQNGMQKVLYDIEMPLCEVLASMEHIGVKVDTDGIKAFGEMLSEQIGVLKQSIYELAGKEFNIASPKQLGEVLFEDLGLPCAKKTKNGYSTNAEVLESLEGKHPIIPQILEYRTLTKLNSTYVEGLLKVVGKDGRVRSYFNQTETRTGRISSSDPNMQNIPVKKELGRNMRRFFVAREGAVLLDADYSQIELRILAAASKDKNLTDAFLSGEDVHSETASRIFDMPADFVTPEMRRAAKVINFGIVYGMGAYSLSKDLGVSVAEARQYIEQYNATYPQVRKYMDHVVETALNDGYVTTMLGRRRYIPELKSRNKMLINFGKRAAMNAPIQGTAADIIKIAMIRVYRRLKEEKLDASLILQVHDELIIEADEKDKSRAAEILHDEMKNAADLSVPLIADVNEGKSWYEAKD